MNAVWDDVRVAPALSRHLEAHSEHLQAGRRIGWKVVFGEPSAQSRRGIDAPLVALMTDDLVPAPGAAVQVGGWTRPGFEPELAAYLAHDLPSGSTREAARAAIEAIGPAIEILDLDGPNMTIDEVMERGAFFRGVVLGPRRALAAPDEEPVQGEIRFLVDGEVMAARDDLATAVAALPALLVHVAALLGAFDLGLRRGDVVLAGALTAPVYPQRDCELTADLGPLGSTSIVAATSASDDNAPPRLQR